MEFDVASNLKCHVLFAVYAEQAAQQQYAEELVLRSDVGLIS
jgi:hypothetical protein